MSDLQTKFHLDDAGRLVVESVQDCTPYVERAKELHRAGAHGSSEFRHAAEIPKVAIEAYINRHGITLQEWWSNPIHIKRMLNDPDLRDFRIWPGKV